MNVAKSTLFLPHGKRLAHKFRGLTDGPDISHHESHHVLSRLVDQQFFIVNKGYQGVWSFLNELDLVGIENKFLAGIEPVKPDQEKERCNLSKEKF